MADDVEARYAQQACRLAARNLLAPEEVHHERFAHGQVQGLVLLQQCGQLVVQRHGSHDSYIQPPPTEAVAKASRSAPLPDRAAGDRSALYFALIAWQAIYAKWNAVN